MLNRIFVREQSDGEYCIRNKKFKIGVIGMSASVGTSFIASSIAKELSNEKEKNIAYVEVNYSDEKTFLYDSLGMDKRFAGKNYYDFYEDIAEGKNIVGLINLDERINWALYLPESKKKTNIKELEAIELCRLINNIAGDYIVCDINKGKKFEEILKEMDVIVFVIDPLPSKLIKGYELFCYIKKCQLVGQKIIWVVNKYNEGINKREFYDFMRMKHFIKIPIIPQEDIYLSEYNCKIPYSLKAINTSIKDNILQILHQFNNKM